MCQKCQSLLKNYDNLHKTVTKSENRIKSYLEQTSEYYRKNFELINIFETRDEIQLFKEELNIYDGDIETKPLIDKLNNSIVESYTKPLIDNPNDGDVDSHTTKTKNTEVITLLENNLPRDKLLDELDTAILSCENSIAQNNSQTDPMPQSVFDSLIVNCSLDNEEDKTEERSEKPYNTRNKRQKFDIEHFEDNVSNDPDFEETFDDDSDDEYRPESELSARSSRNR